MPGSCVLLNSHAAGGRAARLAAPLAAWLAAHAPGTPLLQPASARDARALLNGLPSGSRVVVVGGDGSLHQLLEPLAERRLIAGLVPAGSGNDVARALGLHGLPWQEALRHALQAPASAMDLGEATWAEAHGTGKALFASSLTVGFDSAVVQRANLGPRALRGRPRYVLATLREVARLRNWPMRVAVDGAPLHEGLALFASTLNTPTFGSGMPAVPRARIDDGQLDLLLAGRFGRAATLAMLPRLLLGWHLGHARVRTAAGTRLSIAAAEPAHGLPLAADGEYLGLAGAVSLRVRAGALGVVRGAPR